MRFLAIQTLLIAVGLTGYQPCMAQSTSPADDVMRQVVSALSANDQSALTKLSIDQTEFKKYVWPALAAQMSGSNTNADKYYPTYQKVSQAGIAEATTALAGKKWEIVKINLEPAQRRGKGFQVFGGPVLVLRDEGGQEKTIRVVGSLLERDGAYKVITYYVSPYQKAIK